VVRGGVRFDSYSRHLFSRDASMYAVEPLGVVFPRDADEAAAVVATAARFGVPVLPRGAGTSLAGQTVGRAVVMDFSRHMHQILAIDAEARRARVQPGVVQQQLNLAAGRHGLMFGPDTSTSDRATLGGMIGNNSAGSHSVRYGMTVDHVLSLDVVLSDGSRAVFGALSAADLAGRAGQPTLEGTICRELPLLAERNAAAIATGYPRFWRQSGGYRLDRLPGRGGPGGMDLARFLVGSEGTLVTVVAAEVALVPAPRHRVIAVGHFTSTEAAIEATGDALACEPAAVELIDRAILELARTKLEYRELSSILSGDPGALMFVTFFGDTEDEAAAGLDRLDALWRRHRHGYHTLRARSAADQAALLKVRSAGLGLLMAASTGARRPLAFVEDTAVDPAVLADYARRFRAVLDAHGLTAGFYGHASVGCLHVRPFVDLTEPGQVARMRAVAEEIRDLVLEFGGANSSEHGDGLVRSEFNQAVFGARLYAAMCEVKRLFDPENRMNPGKITGAPPMTSNLRDARPRAGYSSKLEFAGGMRAAADRCMNIGLCRKTSAGVMCPSYMATREEEHSTRGRANALVKALDSADPRAALGDERLHEILDLCLECKACKSECPLGVDMAALKTEALAVHHERHGVPLRSRMFGSVRALNRLGSATAPVANLLGGLRPARLLAQRWLGVAAARPLPAFQRQNLARWHARRPLRRAAPAAGGAQGELVFLADSFTSFTEPAVARAAIELLEAAGWAVRLETSGCCGRASLSKGLIDQAAVRARRLTGLLDGRGPIVGVEPSCLLTLRDEYPALLPDDPKARAVAAACSLPEELLLAAIADGRLALRPMDGTRILFHGHCHQKAITGTAATVALLRAIPGTVVTEVDAGCCGMAGSFGFEAEHYDLSLRIGELRLFPAVRAEPASTIIAASGVSCRQQIAHGTGRAARHPLEIVRSALVPPA
jgi:FAD/FMN-containing dehydrogenase/Fe-S oxidoreductase